MRFILFFLLALSSLSAHPAIVKEEFIYSKALFASCHASTLAETESGAILCAWFGGTEEGAEDVKVWFSSSNGTTWSSPSVIASEKGVPCWNPVLFTLPSNEVLLFYKAGEHPQTWSGFLKRSFDEGKSWSDAELLPAGILGPIKNKPLLLQDGTLLCGSSIESWRRWGCWMDITRDGGLTWVKSNPINVEKQLYGIIQPTLFETGTSVIKMLARSRNLNAICAAVSKDGGKTWSSAHPTSLPNPDAGIDATSMKDGTVALVYNHSKEHRYPLNFATSKDGGESWHMQIVLENTPGEYSYPSIIQTRNGLLHISYTWNRIRIKHVVIDPQKLSSGTVKQ